MSSRATAYTRRDYERYVNRALGWIGAGAACIVAGSLLSLRYGLSMKTVSVSLAGASGCVGMAVYETLQDYQNSRT